MGGVAREQIEEVIGRLVDQYTPGDYIEEWDLEELWSQLDQMFHVDFGPDEIDRSSVDRDELKRLLTDDASQLYEERESELGPELMRALERYLLLQIIDQRWREHLYDMDYLREGIHLRGFAQIEPLVAYKNEAYTLFQDLMNSIWSDFARMIYNVEVEVEEANGNGDGAGALPPAPPTAEGRPPALQYSGGTLDDQPSAYGGEGYGVDVDEAPEPVSVQQRRVDEHEQLGRNDPCWCGSGKKFKKCHGA
jgi:preprotein translocase subunit SecA